MIFIYIIFLSLHTHTHTFTLHCIKFIVTCTPLGMSHGPQFEIYALQFSALDALVSCCSHSVMSIPTAMPLGSTVDVFATEDPNITEASEQELQIYEKKNNVLHGHRKKKYIFLNVSLESCVTLSVYHNPCSS